MASGSFRLALLVVPLAASAWAQKVAVSDFAGPGSGLVRAQLVKALCRSVECVAARASDGRSLEVDRQVMGSVARRGARWGLELSVRSPKTGVKTRRAWLLERNGLLSPTNLGAAVAMVAAVPPKGPEAPPAEAPVVVESSPPRSAPEPPSEVVQRPRPVVPPAPAPAPVASPARVASPAPAPVPSPSARGPTEPGPAPMVVALEVGSDVLNRQLRYSNVTNASASVPPLREYDITAYSLPTVKAEVYPFGRAGEGRLAGLGFEATLGVNPLLQSHAADGGNTYASATLRVSAAIRWRLVVSPTFPLAVTPFLGYHLQSFTVANPTDGSPKLMPNFSYQSLVAGLGVDVPLVKERFSLIARLYGLPVFSPGEIIAPGGRYFSGGSTLGYGVSGGFKVDITRAFHLVATFELTEYDFTFTPQSGDPYLAAVPGRPVGGSDRYLGGNLAARLEL